MANQRRWPGSPISNWTEEEDEKTDTLCLLYIQRLSENVEKGVRDINIRAVSKTTLTLRCYLPKVKIPADPNNTTYNWIQMSGQECRQQQQPISACCWNRHTINLDEAQVVYRVQNSGQKECLTTRTHANSIHLPELEPTSVPYYHRFCLFFLFHPSNLISSVRLSLNNT